MFKKSFGGPFGGFSGGWHPQTLSKYLSVKYLLIRGGVEDTRLEAKDTKKFRGQGQPFRGQTLSRPRTGMLEAKDQEHRRNCSQKKIFFQAISKKKCLQKN